MISEKRIQKRIAELEKQRELFVQQANLQVTAFNAIVEELKSLLNPPKEVEK